MAHPELRRPIRPVFAAGGASDTANAVASAELGDLPRWNLADLYSGMDAVELADDLKRAADTAKAFETKWKGKLAEEIGQANGGDLDSAMRDYESLEELIGRIVSYAGLMYAGDTSDPKRAKLYGDVQEKMTDASAHLLFFTLELNAIDDSLVDAAMDNNAGFGRYRPWIVDLRRDKPYQLEDRVEQLFHEKSVTGRGAWNRLFDETMTALRFEIDGEELSLEPALNRLQDARPEMRQKAAEVLSETFKSNLRTFTLITNTLAKDKEISDRWRGFKDIADSRHLANRVERKVVDALTEAVQDACPRLSQPLLFHEGQMARHGPDESLGPKRAAARNPKSTIVWSDARQTVLDAYAGFAPEMADIAKRFFDKGWIDAPCSPRQGAGRVRPSDRAVGPPYVLLNYQGKPRDVMTLAHELGHGVHQVLAGDQGALMASTPLTLAETASVFGEMLTFVRCSTRPMTGANARQCWPRRPRT